MCQKRNRLAILCFTVAVCSVSLLFFMAITGSRPSTVSTGSEFYIPTSTRGVVEISPAPLSVDDILRQLDYSPEPAASSQSSELVDRCDNEDWHCNNGAALKYINSLRAGEGMPLLQMGTNAMLSYARAQTISDIANTDLVPPMLDQVSLGCGTVLTEELTATTYLEDSLGSHDPAAMCIAELLRSPQSYYNMISEVHKFVVSGIVVGENSDVHCTVLFATETQYGAKCCARATGPDAVAGELFDPVPFPDAEPTSEPWLSEPVDDSSKEVGSHDYKFRHKLFLAGMGSSLTEPLHLACRNRVCRFCTLDGSLCLSPHKSMEMDEYLSDRSS